MHGPVDSVEGMGEHAALRRQDRPRPSFETKMRADISHAMLSSDIRWGRQPLEFAGAIAWVPESVVAELHSALRLAATTGRWD